MNLDEKLECEKLYNDLNIVDASKEYVLDFCNKLYKHYIINNPLPFEEALNKNSRAKYNKDRMEYIYRNIKSMFGEKE